MAVSLKEARGWEGETHGNYETRAWVTVGGDTGKGKRRRRTGGPGEERADVCKRRGWE